MASPMHRQASLVRALSLCCPVPDRHHSRAGFSGRTGRARRLGQATTLQSLETLLACIARVLREERARAADART